MATRQVGDAAASIAWLDRAAEVCAAMGQEGAIDLARTDLSRALATRDMGKWSEAAARAASSVRALSGRVAEDDGLLAFALETLEALCTDPRGDPRAAPCKARP
ncbi:MAG: hypothetical protein AAF721_14300 [Myxococcota bacterium]